MLLLAGMAAAGESGISSSEFIFEAYDYRLGFFPKDNKLEVLGDFTKNVSFGEGLMRMVVAENQMSIVSVKGRGRCRKVSTRIRQVGTNL